MLNEKFVCFAPGWFINSKDPVYQETWKRFYVAKSRPDEGNGWLRGTQLVLMTAAGRLLQGSVKGRDGLAQGLQEVLDAYAKLPAEERRPPSVDGEILPQPLPPTGGIVLTVYDRLLGCDAQRQYRLPDGKDCGGMRTSSPHGQRSSLWLTEDEWKSLLPANPRPGQTQPVPAKLAKRIWLYGLVPQSLWVVEEMWKPDAVREGELQVTVQEVRAQTVRLRLHGAVVLKSPGILHAWPDRKFIKNIENGYDARLEGVIEWDRAANKITRFDLTSLGDFTGRWFTDHKGWHEATAASPLSLGFAFELDTTAFDLPPERRRPRSFVHAYIFRVAEEHYWDPDKWLEDWKKRQSR